MMLVSHLLIKAYKLPSELGLILVKSKKGIRYIEKLSKNSEAFFFMTEIGTVMGYGLLSKIFMKNISLKGYITGFALLAFLSMIVAPTAFAFLMQVIELGSMERSVSTVADGAWWGLALVLSILLIGGFTMFLLFGLMYYGGVILSALISTFIYGTDSISNVSPGGTFLLPGINLPLFEGILALAIVLVVHEGCHAILTRIAKIPLLSSGIVLFGVIPVGAFIEPDEHKLAKLEPIKQTRVLVAGPTANLLSSAGIFVIFLGFLLLINNIGFFQEGIIGSISKFIYVTLGLTFALNFIVGVVNLLPITLFDGGRVVDVNIKNKLIVKALMYVTLFFFIANFLPWFFR
jgi:Zn-dependent protease